MEEDGGEGEAGAAGRDSGSEGGRSLVVIREVVDERHEVALSFQRQPNGGGWWR